MKNASIRPLRRDDLQRVGKIVEATDMFPADMLDGMTSPFFENPDSEQRWVVHDDAAIDGVAYYVPEQLTEGTWNLLLIAVDPASQSKGIGSALMGWVEAELGLRGQRLLLVETSGKAEFEKTRQFYDRLGYEREARIRDYYASGDDKIVFRRLLA